MGREHTDPLLQEVHEWRKKVFKEMEGKSPEERIKYLNEKATKAKKDFEQKKQISQVG